MSHMHTSGSRCNAKVRLVTFDMAAAWDRALSGWLAALARGSVGRIVLHMVAMAGDRCVRFHLAGIIRELAQANATARLVQVRHKLMEALVRYLVEPLEAGAAASAIDGQSLAALLHPGDVLLSVSNTRVAALVKRVTRAPWSHVSLYVGPLEDGPDPRCIVEADIGSGVRPIRLSELNAVQVRVLRPIGLADTDRCRLATWVTGRIGCQYDLAHAWNLGRRLLLQPLPIRLRSMPDAVSQSARRFICCSLLAHGFAVVGCQISSDTARRSGRHTSTDHRHLTPGDFEHAPVSEVIEPDRPGARRSEFDQIPQTEVSIDTILQ